MSPLRLRPEDYWGCHASGCPRDYEVAYDPGATPLNPRRRVQLCDAHLRVWGAELDKLRGAE